MALTGDGFETLDDLARLLEAGRFAFGLRRLDGVGRVRRPKRRRRSTGHDAGAAAAAGAGPPRGRRRRHGQAPFSDAGALAQIQLQLLDAPPKRDANQSASVWQPCALVSSKSIAFCHID